MNFADDFLINDPLTFFILLESNLLQISSGLEVILGYFGFTKFCVLEFSRINFNKFGVPGFSRIVIILFSCLLARLEFDVLVHLFFRLGLSLPCLFPFYFPF